MKALGLLCGVAWLVATAAAGQGPADAGSGAEEAIALLHASLDTSATVVGAPLRLKIQPEVPAGWLVGPPPPDLDLGPFAVRRVSIARSSHEEGEAFVLDLVPLEPGELEIPAISLTARDPAGEEVVLQTETLPIRVASNLPPRVAEAGEEGGEPAAAAEPAPADLKPLLEAPRDWVPVWIAAGSFLVAAVLGFLLLRKLRRLRRRGKAAAPVPRRAKKRLRPAWETALAELERIAAADYVGKGQMARQYIEVTVVLRQYLEDRYGVPALESTTSELRESLAGVALATDARTQLIALLGQADLVKFAKALPEESAARAVVGTAREFVNRTTPAPAAVEREAA